MQHSCCSPTEALCTFPESTPCQSYTGNWEMAAQRALQLKSLGDVSRNAPIQNSSRQDTSGYYKWLAFKPRNQDKLNENPSNYQGICKEVRK